MDLYNTALERIYNLRNESRSIFTGAIPLQYEIVAGEDLQYRLLSLMKFKFENTFGIMQAVVRKIRLSCPFQHSLSSRGGRPVGEAFRQIFKFIFGQNGRVISHTQNRLYIAVFAFICMVEMWVCVYCCFYIQWNICGCVDCFTISRLNLEDVRFAWFVRGVEWLFAMLRVERCSLRSSWLFEMSVLISYYIA